MKDMYSMFIGLSQVENNFSILSHFVCLLQKHLSRMISTLLFMCSILWCAFFSTRVLCTSVFFVRRIFQFIKSIHDINVKHDSLSLNMSFCIILSCKLISISFYISEVQLSCCQLIGLITCLKVSYLLIKGHLTCSLDGLLQIHVHRYLVYLQVRALLISSR